MAEPATPPTARPKSEIAGQPDGMIVASGGDEDTGPESSSWRSRKLSTKAL